MTVLGQLVQLEHLVRLWVVTHRIQALTPAMWAVSVVGRGGMVWLAIGVALTVARRVQPSGLIQLALAILLAFLFADYILKPLVRRDRPFASPSGVLVIGGRPDDSSFPSGHAANAFAGCYILSRIFPAGRIIWWTMAFAIAYSRVYLGVHYPLDVIGGAAVGWLCGILAVRVVAWPRRRPNA